MNNASLLSRTVYGIKRHPIRAILTAGASYLILWSIVEPAITFLGFEQVNGPKYFFVLVVLAVLTGIIRSIVPLRIELKIANTPGHIEVTFEDIFAIEGIRVIPINRYFDGELGDLVSPNSLHGKFLTKIYRGNRQEFSSAVAPHLAAHPFTVVPTKQGNVNQYAIGTAILVGTGSERYILIPTADTDPTTLKAGTDFNTVWRALDSLWSFARLNCGGDPIVVPLIGGGLSGLKLDHRRILDMTLLSLIYHTLVHGVGCKVVIAIEPCRAREIDLRDVATNWGH